MTAPVDATTTGAWTALTAHEEAFVPDLRGWFDADPGRATRLTRQLADLTVDLSKNLVTDETLSLLVALADQVGLQARLDAMFAGEHINVTEDRAVLHTALRRPADAEPTLVVDGQDVDADVQEVLAKIAAFADKVRSGEWTGVTGERVATVVNIGIGGSDLGPVMAYEALKPYVQDGLEVRFVSNIDPTDIAEKTKDLDPTTTLFIVASKTFGTLETLTNARLARDWLWRELVAAGAIEDTEEARTGAVAKHFVAVSTALDKVAAFGIDPENAFGFWDWVGGRYSVDSAIGTSLAIAIGPDAFGEFLEGFHAVDEHVRSTPFDQNVPVLMGLLNVWYVNFLDAHTHAVLPYAQYLHRFPAYLQQLTMESNGKSVRWDGTPVTTETGEVFWGEPGTNGQHAFYQLIHQGTRLIPADFIAVANPAHPLKDGGTDVHGLFLANFFAQTKALAFGKTADEVRAEGTAEEIVPARVFSGNRPTTSILAPALTPSVV
ncbi:MAG TPA: glucose-6-phosphate isomerase, partial [Cellulomonas sp.]|nr:glucose-6-phosphate isomerase [Cellulomonas sp.]